MGLVAGGVPAGRVRIRLTLEITVGDPGPGHELAGRWIAEERRAARLSLGLPAVDEHVGCGLAAHVDHDATLSRSTPLIVGWQPSIEMQIGPGRARIGILGRLVGAIGPRAAVRPEKAWTASRRGVTVHVAWAAGGVQPGRVSCTAYAREGRP